MKYKELAKYIAEAPLYQPKPLEIAAFDEKPEIVDRGPYPKKRSQGFPVPPELVDHHCPRCGKGQNWNGVSGYGEVVRLGINELDYECRNCGTEKLAVWLRVWLNEGRVLVEKVGQHPKLTVALPTDFERALGDSKALYIKGMTSRHAGYCMGALAYIRRVVDDTIDDMLAVLEVAMVETEADAAAIEAVRRARAGKVFEDKVKLAADAMPPHLKPGGMNPFAELHDAYSIGMHGLSDEECCDIVDAMDEAMKYVYTELKTRTQHAALYKVAATKIQQKVAALRARKAERGDA